jgi:hypothetical protein
MASTSLILPMYLSVVVDKFEWRNMILLIISSSSKLGELSGPSKAYRSGSLTTRTLKSSLTDFSDYSYKIDRIPR